MLLTDVVGVVVVFCVLEVAVVRGVVVAVVMGVPEVTVVTGVVAASDVAQEEETARCPRAAPPIISPALFKNCRLDTFSLSSFLVFVFFPNMVVFSSPGVSPEKALTSIDR